MASGGADRAIGLQLVGDQHARCPRLLLDQLAQQGLCSLGIAPALDQNVEDRAVLVARQLINEGESVRKIARTHGP